MRQEHQEALRDMQKAILEADALGLVEALALKIHYPLRREAMARREDQTQTKHLLLVTCPRLLD